MRQSSNGPIARSAAARGYRENEALLTAVQAQPAAQSPFTVPDPPLLKTGLEGEIPGVQVGVPDGCSSVA